ncbi:hypothetical protein LH991_16205 [Schleiferilactobacillus harbinensis]|uniref:Uncharacterized protein n=1 Tax=Schleiferilactobacillus harbinensis DSM 16991 TaxID=1122147 RepID=A0A0R1XG92_9LACO|nr:hypothetical protein [Schleiferilactobacillus harbinensis]KRM29175.1 hypothetical protein FC91_GL000996 [Schleiferilactobacillus harbinensis DSM 16991]QFR62507.1 hypothetical protein LH991_00055 [Schleiferilactobacillus harbinensis]QFR65368.1 hypothetical protein LH991_16205 [Schleiferilactobacillus harbinensis]
MKKLKISIAIAAVVAVVFFLHTTLGAALNTAGHVLYWQVGGVAKPFGRVIIGAGQSLFWLRNMFF